MKNYLFLFAMLWILAACKNPSEEHYKHGIELHNAGDYHGAIQQFDSVLLLDDKNIDAYFNRGNAKFDLGDFEGALEDYNIVVAMGDSSKLEPIVYLNRGDVFRLVDLTDDAIADYSTAIAKQADYDSAFTGRGLTYLNMGDMAHALPDLEKAISLNPQSSLAHAGLAELYQDSEVTEAQKAEYLQKAIAEYDLAISLDPDPKYLLNRGNAHGDLGHNKEAIADFARAIDLDPKYFTAYLNRAIYLSENGKPQEAIRDYDAALVIDPQHANTYYNRGVTRFNMGNKKGACEDFKRALELGSEYAAESLKDCR